MLNSGEGDGGSSLKGLSAKRSRKKASCSSAEKVGVAVLFELKTFLPYLKEFDRNLKASFIKRWFFSKMFC